MATRWQRYINYIAYLAAVVSFAGNPPPASADSLQQLISQLSSGDKNTRHSAALSLSKMGTGAKPAIPALIEVSNDADEQVRSAAALAIGRIGLPENIDSQHSVKTSQAESLRLNTEKPMVRNELEAAEPKTPSIIEPQKKIPRAKYDNAVGETDVNNLSNALQNARLLRDLNGAKKNFAGDKDDGELAYDLGLRLYNSGNVDEAVRKFRMAIVTGGKQAAKAHGALGAIYQEQNRISDAEEEYNAAMEKDSSYENAYYQMIQIRYAAKDYNEIVKLLKSLIEISTNKETALSLLGSIYLEMDKPKLALEPYEKLLAIQPTSEANIVALAEAYQRAGKLSAAKMLLEEATNQFPRSPDVAYALGKVFFKENKYLRCVYTLIKQFNAQERPELAAGLFAQRGFCNEKLQRPEAARKDYLLAIEFRPNDLSLVNRLGYVSFYSGRYEDAIKAYQKVVAAEPNNLLANTNLALSYEREHQQSNALPVWKHVLTLDKNSFVAHIYIGNSYYRNGQYSQTITHYKKALSLEPGDRVAYANLAQSYWKLGHRKDAQDIIFRAVERFPSDREIERLFEAMHN